METMLQERAIEGGIQEGEESREAYYIERLQRLQAEFDNYRKRTEREKAAISSRARMDILTDFVGLCDILKGATQKHGENESADVEAYRKGVELILKQFTDFLSKEGVKAIETEGREFDPAFHEAVMMEEGQEGQSGKIARELQTGYLYNDQVMRPARVSVFK
ncbi:nucleotide exchange factor GrpE [Candidatus Sumerlaeota bacterium]|nr:nucleotide exchange factor GrpE [Candidatus Sumerlaeota bacterium]